MQTTAGLAYFQLVVFVKRQSINLGKKNSTYNNEWTRKLMLY